MSRTSSENTSVDFRINKTNRLIVLNYSSSISSPNKFQVPTTTTNTSIKNTGVILQKSDSKQKLQERTAVVDTKFKNLQWSLLDSVSQSSDDTDRCIQKGMGCSMSRNINRGAMVKGGTVVTYKCVRTESSKISTFDLQQTKIFESSSFSNREHHCTTLKMRGKTITAEYLPSSFNVEADWQSRNSRDPSEWKLCPKVFQQVC